MKRYLTIVLALIIVMSLLTGCGGSKEMGKTVVGGVTEEEQGLIFEAACELWDTATYHQLANDSNTMEIVHGIRYEVEDMEGFNVKLLLAEVGNMDLEWNGTDVGVILVNLNTGEMFNRETIGLEEFIGEYATVQDIQRACFAGYDGYRHHENSAIQTELETRIELTSDELAALNQRLVEVAQGRQADLEKSNEELLKLAENFGEDQKLVFESVLRFKNSGRYMSLAENPDEICVEQAFRYFNDDTEAYYGFAPDLIFVQLAMSQDVKDMYGFGVDLLMIDPADGMFWCIEDRDMDIDYENIQNQEQFYTLMFNCAGNYLENGEGLWTETETIENLPADQIAEINEVLNM